MTPPRSLAETLRSWPDEDLLTLLRLRPDLTVPVPSGLAALASRATERGSVQRALDDLNRAQWQVLETIAVLPAPVTLSAVRRAWAPRAGEMVEALRHRALIWGSDDDLHLIHTARDLLGLYPAGLGPVTPDAPSPERVEELLASAPTTARNIVQELTWGPPSATLPDADRVIAPDTTNPVEWLLVRNLLAPSGSDRVVLPRQVALALRGGRIHRSVVATEPALTPRPAPSADAQAVAAATEAVRLTSVLAELWSGSETPVLRSGGLGVRDLKRAAAALGVTERQAALVAEVAHASGLIANDGELSPRWAPTPEYDDWLARPIAQRWVHLAESWLATTRVAHLTGTRDSKDNTRNALGPGLDLAAAPVIRHETLGLLASLTGAADERDLIAVDAWRHPRQDATLRAELITATLVEATDLGLLGAGALATFAHPLLAGSTDATRRDATRRLTEKLPDPIDHVLLQADLTAVAPGPLTADLAAMMELAADVESRGGATVYRFSTSSLRRALDAGYSGEDLLTWIRDHSRTPIPQPLEYLIGDAARRHGQIRVGTAATYIRSDDEAALSGLLLDRGCATLRLRRIAPTVVIAQADPAEVLTALRGLGLAPAAESMDGVLILGRTPGYRTGPRRRPVPMRHGPVRLPDEALQVAVASMRRSEITPVPFGETPPPPAASPPNSPVEIAVLLTQLRQAAENNSAVWIGFVDGDGQVAQLLVEPIQVDGGRVSAFDRSAARVRHFPVARLTAITPVERQSS